MKIVFIQYPKCSTCQKAKKWLEEKYALLATDGMLVKRPLLITENAALPGFKEADWKEALSEEIK